MATSVKKTKTKLQYTIWLLVTLMQIAWKKENNYFVLLSIQREKINPTRHQRVGIITTKEGVSRCVEHTHV